MQEYKVTVDINRTEWRDLKTLKLHRIDGPAVECGYKVWYVEGRRHRLDGPAVECADGSKSWWVEGKRHRLDGPAIEYTNGYKEWFVEGKRYSENEFNEYVEKLNKPADPCTNKVVEIDGKKYKLTLAE